MDLPHYASCTVSHGCGIKQSVRFTDIVGWIGLYQWQFCHQRSIWQCVEVFVVVTASKAGEVAASLSSG